VGAPAFMRGKERFSAPGDSLHSIVRFSAGGDRPPPAAKARTYTDSNFFRSL
jgi:hypothetical protein